jgi:hypothetical protein
MRCNGSEPPTHFVVEEVVARITLKVSIINRPTEMKVDESPHLLLRVNGCTAPAHIAADAFEDAWP